MKPYYEASGIQIFHGDCREILPTVQADVLVTDPPYGMDWDVDASRFSGGVSGHRVYSPRQAGKVCTRSPVAGDAEPFDPSYLLGYPRAVIFGFHHFARSLPPGSVLVWLKRFDPAFGTFLSDAELAWMKGGCGVYCFRDLSMTGEALTRARLA
jgi:hypothetical protein